MICYIQYTVLYNIYIWCPQVVHGSCYGGYNYSDWGLQTNLKLIMTLERILKNHP